jgi:hypothetical protein
MPVELVNRLGENKGKDAQSRSAPPGEMTRRGESYGCSTLSLEDFGELLNRRLRHAIIGHQAIQLLLHVAELRVHKP